MEDLLVAAIGLRGSRLGESDLSCPNRPQTKRSILPSASFQSRDGAFVSRNEYTLVWLWSVLHKVHNAQVRPPIITHIM